MITVGTRVIVHWEYYEYENNIELVYNGSDTFHGVVIEFDDNPHDNRLKKNGDYLKVKIDEKGKMPNDICYPEEKDVEIENEETLENEIIVRNACQGWTRCSENNEPDYDSYIIIAYTSDGSYSWRYYTYGDCPFSWRILCKKEAYWRKLKPPIRKKEK